MCIMIFAFPMSYCGMCPKGQSHWSLEQHSPKARDDGPEPPTLLDDVHNRCWLLFSHFGPDVAFPAKPQKLPFLGWSAEFS